MTSLNLKRLSLHAISTAAFAALIAFIVPVSAAPGDVGGAFSVGTNLVAQTRLAVEKDTDNAIVITIYIDAIKDGDGNTQPIPGGIGSYSATVSTGADATVMSVRGVAPYGSPSFDAGTGTISVSGLSGTGSPALLRLPNWCSGSLGACTASCPISVTFHEIRSATDPALNVPEQINHSTTFKRGDAREDGLVNIADAMFIAQYTVGIRPLSDLNVSNAASPKDDTTNDILNIADAMFIAQYIVGFRDVNFNLK